MCSSLGLRVMHGLRAVTGATIFRRALVRAFSGRAGVPEPDYRNAERQTRDGARTGRPT